MTLPKLLILLLGVLLTTHAFTYWLGYRRGRRTLIRQMKQEAQGILREYRATQI